MKLLIITQAVDSEDPILGFFVRWIEEFAKHAERIEVICLKEGKHSLPANVRVHSLGKEKGVSRIKYILNFYTYIWRLRRDYDTVFVHMNPEYVVLGGLFWRIWKKRIAFWYLHKNVDLKLRIAVFFANIILTASKESFRLHTKKLNIVGHGIPTNLFICPMQEMSGTLRILTAGRISKTKNISLLLDAADILTARGVPFMLVIAGAPVTAADIKYAERVYARAGSTVQFVGPKTQSEIAALLCEANVFVNLGENGSMDKAVLEALCAGIPVVTGNEAYKHLLEPLGLFVAFDASAIADALQRAPRVNISPLATYVREHHSLQRLIPAILRAIQAL